MPTESRKAINRRHYLKNRERYKAEKLAYYHESYKGRIDPVARSEYHKKWRDENPEKAKRTPQQAEIHQRQATARYRSDPDSRRRKLLRCQKWTRKNPDKVKDMNVRRTYGITIQRVKEMLVEQGGTCAICKKAEGYNFPHVDHCHSTGKVRGLLCQKCNHGIGLFSDDPDRLRAAADYIERSRKT